MDRPLWSVASFALIAFAACQVEKPPLAPAPAGGAKAGPSTAGAQEPALLAVNRSWRLSEAHLKRYGVFDESGQRRGLLIDGLRARAVDGGVEIAPMVTPTRLLGSAVIPAHLGGGLLFWSVDTVYRARRFSGDLEPVVALPSPSRASFGPSFAWIRGSEGQRWAIDLERRERVAPWPLGVVDLTSESDGRVAAFLEGGRALVSIDHGKTWRDVSGQVSGRATTLSLDPGEIAFVASDRLMRLEPDGRLVEVVRRKEQPKDARWPFFEAPLDRALQVGVPLDDRSAAVPVSGAVAKIDLGSGELVEVSRALGQAALDCVALTGKPELLLACHGAGSSAVIADALGKAPRFERRFSGKPALAFAEGVLVVDRACSGEAAPGLICVRDASGRYTQYDRRADFAPDDKGRAPSLRRWIPVEGGGARALAFFERQYLLDAATGQKTPLSEPLDVQAAKEWQVAFDLVGLGDGSIRGFSQHGPLHVRSDGTVERQLLRFERSSVRGPRALAIDSAKRFFQSVDWGKTWLEVAPPPALDSVPRTTPIGCSELGCQIGPWLRVGWEATAPERKATVVTAPPAPALPRPKRPLLECSSVDRPDLRRGVATPPGADPSLELAFGLGVRELVLARGERRYYRQNAHWRVHHPDGWGEKLGLRALLYAEILDTEDTPDGPVPQRRADLAKPQQLSFIEPFDVAARLSRASIPLAAWFAAAVRTGGERPSPFVDDDADAVSLPVLSERPGESAGLLFLSTGPSLLVQSKPVPSVVPISLGAEGREFVPVSAARTGPSRWLVLASSDGTERVFEITQAGSRTLFEIPGAYGFLHYPYNPSALAVDDAGTPVVVRAPSAEEPATEGDPLLLLRPGEAPQALPPWASLTAGNAPECAAATGGLRLILQTRRSWLDARSDGLPVVSDAGMSMMARVTGERICVEAVEVAHDRVGEAGPETWITARFVPQPAAARVGFSAGAEYRQGLRCELRPRP